MWFRTASWSDRAPLAGSGPGVTRGQSLFLVCIMVNQARAGRAKIDIVRGRIDKVLFDIPVLGLAARGQRLGGDDRDTGRVGRAFGEIATRRFVVPSIKVTAMTGMPGSPNSASEK